MKVDVSSLMGGNRTLQGVFLGAEIGRDRALQQHPAADRREAARGELKVVIDRTFPLSGAAAAHAYIEPPGGRWGGVLPIPRASPVWLSARRDFLGPPTTSNAIQLARQQRGTSLAYRPKRMKFGAFRALLPPRR